jgi:hypothetical protein
VITATGNLVRAPATAHIMNGELLPSFAGINFNLQPPVAALALVLTNPVKLLDFAAVQVPALAPAELGDIDDAPRAVKLVTSDMVLLSYGWAFPVPQPRKSMGPKPAHGLGLEKPLNTCLSCAFGHIAPLL